MYAYDLDKHMMPVNRRVFGMVSRGIADGLHVDDDGNVWTAESDGVVVRNPAGKTIGVFNGPYYLSNKDNEAGDPIPIANFALAGDTLVILAVDRIWTVKLAKMIVETWLNTEFEGGRHQRRVDMIMEIEGKA